MLQKLGAGAGGIVFKVLQAGWALRERKFTYARTPEGTCT